MKVHDITRTVVSTAGDGKLRIVIWWKGGWDDGHADTAIFVPLDGLRSFGYFPDEGRLLITADANYDLWFRDRAAAVDTLTAIASYWLAHVSPDVDEPGDAEAVPGAKVLYPEGTAFSTDDPAARPTHGRIMSNGVLRLGTPGNPEGGAWRRIDWDYIENQRWDALDAANALIGGETIQVGDRPCRLQYLDEAEAEAEPEPYVQLTPVDGGGIDHRQLDAWLEQVGYLSPGTICTVRRDDLTHLIETTRRYGKIAEALRTLRTIQ